MNFVRQFVALLRMGLEGDGTRIGSVLTILIGVTCTVAVLVAMLAMGTGAHQQALGDVRDDEAVVQTKGSGIVQSDISRDEALAVRDLPGIATDEDGQLRVDDQVLAPVEGRRRGTGRRVFFPLFGTSDPKLEEPGRLTDGRMFRPGLHELVATNACVQQFDGFGLGDKREVRGLDWTIVGHFDRGQNLQCVVLTASETLMTAFGRNGFNQITVRLKSPADFDSFRRALEANPSVKLEAKRARDSVEEQFKQFNGLLNFVSYFIGTITAIGATFGAVNSLYSIVDSR
ncbi:MAG: ABC transporter permease, partial [Sinobacteraceae bacterium]|nr:ABC transporter permease [Nevskiaceae bacterium]